MRIGLRNSRRQAPRPKPRTRPAARPPRYWQAAGIDVRAEAERLSRLEALGGEAGPLVVRPPEVTVRRASKRPRSRLGFAIPDENRISVTVYPGIRRGDLEETLLHELVHLAVGASPGGRRWHGREFTDTLRRAMAEGYGIRAVRARNSYHGAYADALERKHAREAALAARGVHPEQLRLTG
jgi:hypothetical protein